MCYIAKDAKVQVIDVSLTMGGETSRGKNRKYRIESIIKNKPWQDES
jgi:hypothetical protein